MGLERLQQTTRQYSRQKVRIAVGAAATRVQLPDLGETREIKLTATVRCSFAFGDNTITAAPPTPAAGQSAASNAEPLPADMPWHEVVPTGVTHISVIGDVGFLTLTPVA